MTATQLTGRLMALVMLGSLPFIMTACPDDNSITDCSKRGVPQHWDGKRWTCKK